MIDLIPSFGNSLFTIGAFVIALSVIVAVHEYGHYIVGRWCGIKAEVFSIGFGPVLTSRTDRHGTVWQIAAVPLGGYVKFLGDANAASAKASDDFDALEEDVKRHTMHGAPLWARAATVAAGPFFNFILSILVFGAVLAFRGIATDPLTIDEIQPMPGGELSIRAGDEILAVGGTELGSVAEFGAFIDALPAEAELDYLIRRDGREMSVVAPHPYPPIVGSLTPGWAAISAGIEVDDVIQSVNGEPIPTFGRLVEVVSGSNGAALDMVIWREGETYEVSIQPDVRDFARADGSFETRYMIGAGAALLFTPQAEAPGLFEALGFGVERTIGIVRSTFSGLYLMVRGDISHCNLQGPVGIAQASGAAASQGWITFIGLIAGLSTAIGLLNLFPIPVLDGGHLVFHAYEAVAGRPPSDGAMRVLMTIGLALLAALMVLALTNDFFCP